jgi:alpha-glucosidase (family GH31 glycosyl hydrolase)
MLCALCGCAPLLEDEGALSLPHGWSIAAQNIRVEVREDPYGFSVSDGAGKRVLSTSLSQDGSGLSAAAWTKGRVRYESGISPGHFTIGESLEPYREPVLVEPLQVDRDRVSLRLVGEDGQPSVHTTLRVKEGKLRVEAWTPRESPRAWSVGFEAPQDESYLGFGERFNALDQRGQQVFNWAEEGGIGLGEGTVAGKQNPWPSGATMTYYPVPYFVSTRGYAFWLDTTYYSRFDLQQSQVGKWRVTHHGPRLAFEVYVPSTADPRPWPHQLTDRFTKATGRPMLPPKWAFGPRRRVGSSSKRDGVSEIQAMRDQDLAITSVDDALHFFPAASQRGRESALRAWTAEAKRLGYRVNAYFNSFVARSEPAFEAFVPAARDRGFFLQRPDGDSPNLWILTGGRIVQNELLDLTNGEAKRWYQSHFDQAIDLGYSGWMYDFGEYVPADVLASDGTTGEALHNQYPVLYAKTLHEHMQKSALADDWLAFMRSGYTGSSAFVPMVWAGDPAASFEDADGLPSMVRAGLSLSISGAPFWGGDIGGYHCVSDGAQAADAELLVRWIQQGALSPNMQTQNACVGSAKGTKASIWSSEPVQDAWRTYARLHTRLFPYLYTWALRAHRYGEALMRPLFFEHPERPELAGIDDAYYLGPALLVAPVVSRGARHKQLDLPDDTYVDWDTGQLVRGGPQQLDAPLDKLPLLLRAGHIVPLLDASIDTLARESNPDVVGPDDVADVYDVRVLLSPEAPSATLTLHDGEHLEIRLRPDAANGAVRESRSIETLELTGRGDLESSQLTIVSTSKRMLRWHVAIAQTGAPAG